MVSRNTSYTWKPWIISIYLLSSQVVKLNIWEMVLQMQRFPAELPPFI